MKKRPASPAGSSKPPACAKCGACSTVCPVYRVTGREYHTGRGKLHLLEMLDPNTASATYADILSRCLLCGACSAVCSRKIPVAEQLAAARAQLHRKAGEHVLLRRLAGGLLSSPKLLQILGPLARHFKPDQIPADSGLKLRLGLALPPEPQTAVESPPEPAPDFSPGPRLETAPAYLFSGCYGAYLDPAIDRAVGSLMVKAGQEKPRRAADCRCCGLAAHSSGRIEEAQRLARINIAAHPGSAPIVVSCASCVSHLSRYPELLAEDRQWRGRAEEFAARLREFSLFLHEAAGKQPLPVASAAQPRLKILYHDPCHLRFGLQITDPPRQLLTSLPAAELVELPRGPRCCGQGGLFHLAHPVEANAILAELAQECRQSDAEIVTSTCSGCLLHWQKARAQKLISARVVHLAVLLDRLTDPGPIS